MDESQKLRMLEDIMEADEGDLTPETVLEELELWDSMTQLSLIALLDDEFGKELSGEDIAKFKVVADILAVMHR